MTPRQVDAEADVEAAPVHSDAVIDDEAVSELSEGAAVEAVSVEGEPVGAGAEPVVRTPVRRVVSPGRARQVRSPGRRAQHACCRST